jgi:hypothetical protein
MPLEVARRRLRKEGRTKDVFFEEKNQKTFASLLLVRKGAFRRVAIVRCGEAWDRNETDNILNVLIPSWFLEPCRFGMSGPGTRGRRVGTFLC